jgi:hypothetical protein
MSEPTYIGLLVSKEKWESFQQKDFNLKHIYVNSYDQWKTPLVQYIKEKCDPFSVMNQRKLGKLMISHEELQQKYNEKEEEKETKSFLKFCFDQIQDLIVAKHNKSSLFDHGQIREQTGGYCEQPTTQSLVCKYNDDFFVNDGGDIMEGENDPQCVISNLETIQCQSVADYLLSKESKTHKKETTYIIDLNGTMYTDTGILQNYATGDHYLILFWNRIYRY